MTLTYIPTGEETSRLNTISKSGLVVIVLTVYDTDENRKVSIPSLSLV